MHISLEERKTLRNVGKVTADEQVTPSERVSVAACADAVGGGPSEARPSLLAEPLSLLYGKQEFLLQLFVALIRR